MFQTSSVIESVATRADGTLKIVVSTQELRPEQMTQLFQLKGQQGWFLFKENSIEKTDIPEEPAPEINQKTPGQRLRANLYVFWNKNTNKVLPFNQFYEQWIEKKIREIQETIN